MKYMGSKARHSREILNVILSEVLRGDIPHEWNWVEPFVGGANMIDKVPSDFNRFGNDVNIPLIEMFKAVQKGWIPPDRVTEDEYRQLMSKSDIHCTAIESALIGFVGIGCSYSGKWFGGYARGNDSKGNPRNYCTESKKNLLNQDIKGIIFTSGDYQNMSFPPNSIIYCDPPYEGATKYNDFFNHENFWKWCDRMIEEGHMVFVSEYHAPKEWHCIWEKQVNSSLTKETGSKQGIEKLFTK